MILREGEQFTMQLELSFKVSALKKRVDLWFASIAAIVFTKKIG